MGKTMTWVSVALSLLIGLVGGYVLGVSRPGAASGAGATTVTGDPEEARRSGADQRRVGFDEPSGARRVPTPRGQAREPEREREWQRERTRSDDDPDDTSAAAPDGIFTTEEQLQIETLQRELAALQQERNELMGEPVEAPADQPSRFGGSSMSAAVGGALKSEGVGGEVEATDCSEHPCIIFGRLEGDEEDMEEIERSPALAAYQDDVLTLLFWATSVEAGETAKMPETGLFALAFYSVEERAENGEKLDRRIRARVMEYWNTDRPGRQG